MLTRSETRRRVEVPPMTGWPGVQARTKTFTRPPLQLDGGSGANDEAGPARRAAPLRLHRAELSQQQGAHPHRGVPHPVAPRVRDPVANGDPLVMRADRSGVERHLLDHEPVGHRNAGGWDRDASVCQRSCAGQPAARTATDPAWDRRRRRGPQPSQRSTLSGRPPSVRADRSLAHRRKPSSPDPVPTVLVVVTRKNRTLARGEASGVDATAAYRRGRSGRRGGRGR